MSDARFLTPQEVEELEKDKPRFLAEDEVRKIEQQNMQNLNQPTRNLIQRRQNLSQQPPYPVGGTSPRMMTPPAPMQNSLIQAVAANNVDLTGGMADPRVREGAQMAANDTYAVDFLRREGYDATILPEVGVVFRNEKTGLWTPIDEAGFTKNDVTVDPRNEAIQYGPEVAGATPGAFLTPYTGPGAAVAMSAGGGIGAAMGEYYRSKRARALGVREPENLTARMWQKAETAAMWGLAGDAAVGAVQAIRMFLNPARIALDPAAIRNAVESLNTETSQQYQKVINDTLEAARRPERLDLTLGQLSDDAYALGTEQDVLRNAFRNKMLIKNKENKTALEAYFDVITPLPEDVGIRNGAEEAARVGNEVLDVVKEHHQKNIRLAEQAIESAENDGFMFVSSRMDLMSEDAIGSSFRGELDHARSAMKKVENYRYREARKLYGYDEVNATSSYKIPWSKKLANFISQMDAEARSALFSSDAAGKEALTKGLKQNKDIFFIDSDGAAFHLGEPIDLDAMIRGLQHLGRVKRAKVAGEVATDPAGRDIIRLESIMKSMVKEELLNKSATDPNALKAYNALVDAWDITSIRARTFDRGVVGEILKKQEGGGWAISNERAMQQFFMSADKQSLDQVSNIAFRKSPRMRNEMRRLIFATYRSEVAKSGVPDVDLHKAFMRNHGDLIDTFFPSNASRIKKDIEYFPKAIERSQKNLNRMEAEINSKLGNKVVRVETVGDDKIVVNTVNADDLAQKVLSGAINQDDVGDILNILNKYGERRLVAEWKSVVGDRIRRRVVSGKSPAFSVTKLDTLLDRAGTLRRLYGGRYVDNLRVLKQAIIRQERRDPASSTGSHLDRIINHALRPVFRPLSREGLIRNAALVIRREAANKIAADILTDPVKLNIFLKLRTEKSYSPRVANILSQINANDLANLPDEQPYDLGEQ